MDEDFSDSVEEEIVKDEDHLSNRYFRIWNIIILKEGDSNVIANLYQPREYTLELDLQQISIPLGKVNLFNLPFCIAFQVGQ